MKNRTNKLTQKGFIQIPILIIAVLGIVGVSTGGYYTTKTILNNDKEQITQNEQSTTVNEVIEETATSTDDQEVNDNEESLPVNGVSNKDQIEIDKKRLDFRKNKVEVESNYPKELEITNNTFNSLRWLANDVEETKKELENYDEEFIDLEEKINKTLKEIYALKKNLENNTVSLSDEFLISILDIKEEDLFSDFDLLKKKIAVVEDFDNYDSYEVYETNYSETDLSDVYSKFDEINNTLDNLEPLETDSSNCKYPKDNRILIPGGRYPFRAHILRYFQL